MIRIRPTARRTNPTVKNNSPHPAPTSPGGAKPLINGSALISRPSENSDIPKYLVTDLMGFSNGSIFYRGIATDF
jgi:hypothetical protein